MQSNEPSEIDLEMVARFLLAVVESNETALVDQIAEAKKQSA
jgi:hypothetical protein